MALYADIVAILAPGQADPGSVVQITVQVKNLSPNAAGIKVTGVPEYPGLPAGLYIDFPVSQLNFNPGELRSFYGSFTMPDQVVTVRMYSYWYGTDGCWHPDDEMTAVINTADLPPPPVPPVDPEIREFKVLSFSRI
jgi:hypothetical protein